MKNLPREIVRKKKQNHQCAKHTSKTTSKCKQKIHFQFLTLTIKTSLVSLAQNATPPNVDSPKKKKKKTQMYGR